MSRQLAGQQALCPAPEPPPLARAEHYAGAVTAGMKILRSGSGACHECVWVCHEADRRGERAPAPLPARHHIGAHAARIDLCDGHMRLWREQIERLTPATARRGRR